LAERRNLRQSQKELTQRTVLSAAREVFEEKGYTRSTVEDIVERAGASRGTFYLYFRSKADVMSQLAQRIESVWEVELKRNVPFVTPEALEAWLMAIVKATRRSSTFFRALEEAEYVEPEVAEVMADLSRKSVDALARQLFLSPTHDELTDDDRVHAFLLQGLIHRLFRLQPVFGREPDWEQAVSFIGKQYQFAVDVRNRPSS
jgi:AcrR family transcriptional regulator